MSDWQAKHPGVYCIVGNSIDREPENGEKGCVYKEGVAIFDLHFFWWANSQEAIGNSEKSGK